MFLLICIKTNGEHWALGLQKRIHFCSCLSDLLSSVFFWNWWWKQSNPNNKDWRRRQVLQNQCGWYPQVEEWVLTMKGWWKEFKVRRSAGSTILYFDMYSLFYCSMWGAIEKSKGSRGHVFLQGGMNLITAFRIPILWISGHLSPSSIYTFTTGNFLELYNVDSPSVCLAKGSFDQRGVAVSSVTYDCT